MGHIELAAEFDSNEETTALSTQERLAKKSAEGKIPF